MPGIDAIAYELGSEWIPTTDVVRGFPDKCPPGMDVQAWAERFCRDRNLREVCVERKRGVTEIAAQLMERFVDGARIGPEDVDLFVYGGVVEQGEGGARPFKLAHDLGMTRDTQFMWHFVGCATGLSAVNTALERLRATGGRHALVLLNCVIADESEHPRLMAEMVCGDAVMVLHVTTGPARWEVTSTHVTALLEYHSYGLVPGVPIDPFVVVREGVRHLREHLRDGGLDEVAAILPVYNGFAQWPRFARALDYPLERIRLDTLPHGAHIDCIDPLRSLTDLEDEFPPGSKVLLYAQTLGVTFNSTLLTRRAD